MGEALVGDFVKDIGTFKLDLLLEMDDLLDFDERLLKWLLIQQL